MPRNTNQSLRFQPDNDVDFNAEHKSTNRFDHILKGSNRCDHKNGERLTLIMHKIVIGLFKSVSISGGAH